MDRIIFKKDIYKKLRDIDEELYKRMELGEINYGDEDVCASYSNLLKRDIFLDFEEEVLDLINYLKLDLIKIRMLRKRVEDKLNKEKK